jgi:pyridoxamine 5'-phosphate oxidase
VNGRREFARAQWIVTCATIHLYVLQRSRYIDALATAKAVMTSPDPFNLFRQWFTQASTAGIDKPNAMALATVDARGRPNCRIVLLSSFDERGFVFHTNYQSRKGDELSTNARASLVFWWDPLGYQIRIEGTVMPTSPAESDAYFAKRPRGSQLGAWASDQSRPLESREQLEARVRELDERYRGQPVPRPPHWGGYRVVPERIEFWENRDNRLHDRWQYERVGDAWRVARLAP